MAERPLLEIVDGDLAGAHFQLLADRLTIGRAESCDVCLDNVQGVSRRHAELRLGENGTALIKDLGSHNGIYIDGERTQETTLTWGQVFRIGAVGLRLVDPVRVGAREPVPAAPAAPMPMPALTTDVPAGDAYGMTPAAAVPPASASARAAGLPAEKEEPGAAFDAESLLGAATAGSARAALSVLLLAALLLGLGYAAHALTLKARPTAQYLRVVAIGEKKVIFNNRPFNNYRLAVDAGDIDLHHAVDLKDFDGMLAEPIQRWQQENATRGKTALYFLIAVGRERTDEPVTLEWIRTEQDIEEIPVIVRGVAPGAILRIPANDSERLEWIRRAEANARTFRADGNLYFAIQELEEAYRLAADGLHSELMGRHQGQLMILQNELRARLGKLFDEAMNHAFPDAPRKPEYARAIQVLMEAKRAVPDPENVDWQAIDFWEAWLMRIHLATRRAAR